MIKKPTTKIEKKASEYQSAKLRKVEPEKIVDKKNINPNNNEQAKSPKKTITVKKKEDDDVGDDIIEERSESEEREKKDKHKKNFEKKEKEEKKNEQKEKEQKEIPSDNDSSDNFEFPIQHTKSFLNLSIEPIKRIELDDNIEYAHWINSENEYTSAIQAASIAFLEQIRLYSNSSLSIMRGSSRFEYLSKADIPSDMFEELKKCKNVEIVELIRKNNKMKDVIGNFMLKCIEVNTKVQKYTESGMEIMLPIIWDTIAQVVCTNVEVYTREENSMEKLELKKTIYRHRGFPYFVVPLRFMLESASVAILYTSEEAERAGYKKQPTNRGIEVQRQKCEDYISILEDVFILNNEEKLRSLESLKENLEKPKTATWDDIKEEAKNEIKELFKERTASKKCEMCNKKKLSDKFIKLDCKHNVDIICLQKYNFHIIQIE